MKRALSMVMVMAVAACVAVGSVEAGMKGPGRGRAGEGGFHGGRGFLGMLDRLGLNADQERDIAAILSKHREEIGKVVTGIADARIKLREAVTAEDYSEDTVRRAAQSLGDQQEQAAVLAAQVLSEVKPLLSADQKERLKDFGSRRSDRMQGFFEARLAELDEWIANHSR